MTQGTRGKVTGWTTAYNISGVVLFLTVQARSRDEAVSFLGVAGFPIQKPQAVQRTITISHKDRDCTKGMRPRNIKRESRRITRGANA